jgi:hypothetical protein
MPEATDITRRKPVIGLKTEDLDDLSTLALSVDELSEGMLSDITAKIIGMEVLPGGELRTDDSGREYVTPDRLAIDMQVDNAADLGLESDTITWYMNLPKVIVSNGQKRRMAPSKQSDYGVFLQSLENFGISGNPQNAAVLHIKSISDLIGLHFRRQQKTVANRDGSQRRQYEITEIYGIDNDIRKEAGLKPIKLDTVS